MCIRDSQNIQSDCRDREDDERDDQCAQHVVARKRRYREICERDQRQHEPAVLRDRQQLLIGRITGLELTVFSIEHGDCNRSQWSAKTNYTRSIRLSPNRPSGRTSRNSNASTYANQFSMPPPARSNCLTRTGPRKTSANFSPTPMINPPRIAPG